jgi:hypothetical protein
LKIIVTTSDRYLHILPIFCHLFNTYWDKSQSVEIVGYKTPEFELPANFSFHSLGIQTDSNKDFSNDLIPYFDKQDRRFIWCMEDTFLKAPVRFDKLELCKKISVEAKVGRVSLTNVSHKEYSLLHSTVGDESVYSLAQVSEYRLSTMPAIWKKDFLLQYLTANLNPWEFECQTKVNDSWDVVALHKHSAPVTHNEGVRRRNIFEYDLTGIDQKVIDEMKALKYL